MLAAADRREVVLNEEVGENRDGNRRRRKKKKKKRNRVTRACLCAQWHRERERERLPEREKGTLLEQGTVATAVVLDQVNDNNNNNNNNNNGRDEVSNQR